MSKTDINRKGGKISEISLGAPIKDVAQILFHSVISCGKNRNEILLKAQEQSQIQIPVSIFSTKLSSLEALVKYLKEEIGLRNVDIAEQLVRSEKTIWSAYDRAIKDGSKLWCKEGVMIPLGYFADRNLSVLEVIVRYLHMMGMGFSAIARMLNLSPKTIWTINKRSEKKPKTRPVVLSSKDIDPLYLAIVCYDILHDELKISDKKIRGIVLDKTEIFVPAALFGTELSPLEALCNYLKTRYHLEICEISRLLNRSNKTIWSALQRIPVYYEIPEFFDGSFIPVRLFADRNLSCLEHIVSFLHKSMRFVEIAKLLDLDPRTVWTSYKRSLKKRNESK